jgi:hypothetical protein
VVWEKVKSEVTQGRSEQTGAALLGLPKVQFQLFYLHQILFVLAKTGLKNRIKGTFLS